MTARIYLILRNARGHRPRLTWILLGFAGSTLEGSQETQVSTLKINRREFMVTSFTVGGGFALSLAFPRSLAAAPSPAAQLAGTPWESLAGKETVEINPWLVIGPDDTVTIRVAQS